MSDVIDNFVSGRELARRLGVDERMVRKHVANGLIAAEKSGPHAGKFDAARCMELIAVNKDPDGVLRGLAGAAAVRAEDASEGAGRDLPENRLTRARTASALLKARAQEIELARLQGKLISKEDARRAVAMAVTIINERLDGLAGQLGPRVCGIASAAEVEKVAREVINGLRGDIAALADAVEGVGSEA